MCIFQFQKKRILGVKNRVLGGFSKKMATIDQKWSQVFKTSKKSKIGAKSDFLGPKYVFFSNDENQGKPMKIEELLILAKFWQKYGPGVKQPQNAKK